MRHHGHHAPYVHTNSAPRQKPESRFFEINQHRRSFGRFRRAPPVFQATCKTGRWRPCPQGPILRKIAPAKAAACMESRAIRGLRHAGLVTCFFVGGSATVWVWPIAGGASAFLPAPIPTARMRAAPQPLAPDGRNLPDSLAANVLKGPMIPTRDYSFRKVTFDDLALLKAWQLKPHVSQWWGPDAPFDAVTFADPRVARWIVSNADRPFAFMQDYSVHGWHDHHFAHLPQGARGIDQYIADPEMIGLGHGPAFIGTRMQALFAAGAPVIATDPHPSNQRAIAAYRKLGFTTSGPPQETRWGLILPMLAWRSADRTLGAL